MMKLKHLMDQAREICDSPLVDLRRCAISQYPQHDQHGNFVCMRERLVVEIDVTPGPPHTDDGECACESCERRKNQ